MDGEGKKLGREGQGGEGQPPKYENQYLVEPARWNDEQITRKLVKLEVLGLGCQRKTLLEVPFERVDGTKRNKHNYRPDFYNVQCLCDPPYEATLSVIICLSARPSHVRR